MDEVIFEEFKGTGNSEIVLGELPVGSRATEDARQRLAGVRNLARLATDRSRDVVLTPQFVEDGAADTRDGEGGEGEAARRC